MIARFAIRAVHRTTAAVVGAQAVHTAAKGGTHPAVKTLAPQLVVTRAEGTHVYTADGESYLDFTSGIGVCSTGHCHPTVAAAAAAQCATAVHLQQSCYTNGAMLSLVDELAPLVHPILAHEPEADGVNGADGEDVTFFFANSGAEAVEAAMRLARQATQRDVVVAMQGGYHGRTSGTLAVTTSSNAFRGGRPGPLPGGTLFAPFPYRTQVSELAGCRAAGLLDGSC